MSKPPRLGRRIDGEVQVLDCPRSGRGRCYFVAARIDAKVKLAIVFANYRPQTRYLGAWPMSRLTFEPGFVPGPLED